MFAPIYSYAYIIPVYCTMSCQLKRLIVGLHYYLNVEALLQWIRN